MIPALFIFFDDWNKFCNVGAGRNLLLQKQQKMYVAVDFVSRKHTQNQIFIKFK